MRRSHSPSGTVGLGRMCRLILLLQRLEAPSTTRTPWNEVVGVVVAIAATIACRWSSRSRRSQNRSRSEITILLCFHWRDQFLVLRIVVAVGNEKGGCSSLVVDAESSL